MTPPVSLCILSQLVAASCYTYQTEPLFMSFSDLAALEAKSRAQTAEASGPIGGTPAAGGHKVKTLEVKCDEDGVEVVLKVNLFDPGRPVRPSRLRLGLGLVSASQSLCAAAVSGDGEYVIRAPLTGCGGKVMLTESSVQYNNMLLYSPPASPPGTYQAKGAAIPLQCEYKRKYTVSSGALRPTWFPLISTRSTYLHLDFQLRLMTNDWSSERKSPLYFLGETVNMEASVDPPLPLHLYVDSCVATLTSDVNSYPRYPFIDHQGCFADSQLSGSTSGFLPRVRNNLLQIQLEPFFFHQDPRRTIYITCHLEAEPRGGKDPRKKACSLRSGRWKSADGDDQACESCNRVQERDHSPESGHKRAPMSKQNELHMKAAIGPLIFLPWKAERRRDDKHLHRSY